MYAEVGDLVEPVTEVERRCDVEHVPNGINVFSLVVLREVG